MGAIVKSANEGVPVLGVCNGFQILTETGVLPGALLRNAGLKYICRTVNLKVATSESVFTQGYNAGDVIGVPIAHHDGNYFADADTIKALQDQGIEFFGPNFFFGNMDHRKVLKSMELFAKEVMPAFQ